jgi:hypothetical protein
MPLTQESGDYLLLETGDRILLEGETAVDNGASLPSLHTANVGLTYYVNATTGNDSTGDGSSGAPWASLQKAYTYLRDTATWPTDQDILIEVAAGTYQRDAQQYTLDTWYNGTGRQPTATQWVIWNFASGAVVKLPSGTSPTTHKGAMRLDTVSSGVSSYQMFIGMEIDGEQTRTNSTGDAIGVYLSGSTSNVQLVDCHIHGIYAMDTDDGSPTSKAQGVFIAPGGTNNIVTGCRIHDIGTATGTINIQEHCVYTSGDSTYIFGNVIYDAPNGYGIQCYDGGAAMSNVLIASNTIGGTIEKSCIVVPRNGTSITIKNNILYGATQYGVEFFPTTNAGSSNVLDYNVIDSCTLGDLSHATSTSWTITNTATTDPSFTNYAGRDFTLQSGSPAIGHADPDYATATDFAGETRDGTPDAGAYEHIPSVAVTGTAAWTEAADTSAASGAETFTGTSSWTEDADTVAASGHMAPSGTAAWTEAADTAAGTGQSLSPITGTAAWTEDADTITASGSAFVGAVSTVADTFTGTTIAAQWTTATNVTQNNRLILLTRTDYQTFITTAETLSVVGSSVFCEFATIPAVARYSSQMWFYVNRGAARFGTRLDVSGGVWQLSCWHHNGTTDSLVGTAVAYNASTMRFVRIREASGTMYLDTASDPAGTWTNRWSLTTPSWVPLGVSIGYAAGFWDSPADTAGTFEIDNLNVVPVTGTSTWTEAPDTIAASGALTVTGTSAWTEAADTIAASGTQTLATVTGTAAWTEAADVLMSVLLDDLGDPVLDDLGDPVLVTGGAVGFAAASAVTGTSEWTEAADTIDAQGLLTVAGASEWTEDDDELAAEGSTLGISGSAAWAEDDDTLAAAGWFELLGSASWTEAADTVAASGTAAESPIHGDAFWAEAPDTITASGVAAVPVFGGGGWVEDDDIVIGRGNATPPRFEPPTTPQGGMYRPRDHRRGRRLFAQARNVDRGVTVVKKDGVYQTVAEGPDVAFLATCDEVYLGGHIYEVDVATATALEEAGFDVPNIVLAPIGSSVAWLEEPDTATAQVTQLAMTSASVAFTEETDSWVAAVFQVEPGDAIVMSAAFTEANDTAVGTVTAVHEAVTFTGTNGAAWPSPFAAIATSSGSTATIQSNRGRLTTTTGSYSGSVYRGFTPASQDYEITADLIVVSTANEGYQRLAWRANTDGREYALSVLLASNEIRVHEQDAAFAQTVKGSETSVGFTNGTVVHTRIRVEGSDHKVRWWLDAESEPGTWNVEFTDTTHTSGAITCYLVGGNATATVNADFDNFELDYIDAVEPPPGENELPDALLSTHGNSRTLTWTARRGAWGTTHFNNEQQRYIDSGVVFQNASGAVVSSAGTRVIMTADDGASTETGFSSGATNRQDLNDPVHPGDYIQARMKIETGAGVWGAFWLMPQAGGAQFELDVFEGGWQATSFDINHHEDTAAPYEGSYNLNEQETVAIDPSEYFNVGVHLDDTKTDYYVNGTLALSYPRPCTVDMFPILNLALGGPGSYPGSIDGTTPYPVVFEVDSVKVWETTGGGGEGPGAMPVVIGLHGYQGGPSLTGSYGSGRNYPASTGGDVAFTTYGTTGPFAASPSGRAWADDYNATPRYVYSEYIAAVNAAIPVGATDIWLAGFSDGAGVCLDLLRLGEDFDGRLRGVVLDDPAPAVGATYSNPNNIPVVLYATSPNGTTWNVNNLSGFDVLTPIETALGITRKRSSDYGGSTDHAPMTRSGSSGPYAVPELLSGSSWAS